MGFWKRFWARFRASWSRADRPQAPPSTDSASGQGDSPDKTTIRRIEQHRDRWTSIDASAGILELSELLSPKELRRFAIFKECDEKLLAEISPDVSVAVWGEGSVLFEEGSYIDLAFFVVRGQVHVSLERLRGESTAPNPIFDVSRTRMVVAEEPSTLTAPRSSVPKRSASNEITFLATMDFDMAKDSVMKLDPGEFFGEIGALSGWPQSVTARAATQCELVQIRLPALRKLRSESPELKKRLDKLYRERTLLSQLQTAPLFRGCNEMFLRGLQMVVELVSCKPGEVVVREGERPDALYLLRSGFVKLSQRFGKGDMVVTYLSKGMTLGEVELLIPGLGAWEVTAESVEHAELVKIPKDKLEHLLRIHPETRRQLWTTAADRIKEAGFTRRNIDHSEFTQMALDKGLVQGNSILVIDLDVCTRCDDCVRGCAASHGGRPRFVREGNKYDNLLIAKSCYHCRDPVCLIGCPTGAIHRAGVGHVVEISEEVCIGCSNCARKCPYDAIVMHHEEGETWSQDMVPERLRGEPRLVASKCDLCYDTGHDPACVNSCPQGCAFRVGSLEEFRGLVARSDGP